MVAFSKIALAASISAVMASPTPSIGPLSLFQDIKAVPAQWISQGAAPKSQLLRAQIGLKQSNIKQLEAKLMDISNPKSKNYGKWLSKTEINALTAPPKKNVDAIKAWLAANGITKVDQPSPDWIEFTVPVGKMESLLETKYESFIHSEHRNVVPGTTQYSLPKELHDVIDMVTPTTAFYSKLGGIPTEHKKVAVHSVNKRDNCIGSRVTPQCMIDHYNVDYTPSGQGSVGTTSYQGEGAVHNDFSLFTQSYASNAPDFQDVSVADGQNAESNSNDIGEGNLDTQWAAAMASPNPSQFISCGPQDVTTQAFSDGVANFASWLTSADNVPTSVSSSYGDIESHYGSSYMDRVCNEFMKAGSAGISVFWSSGDSGIAGNREASCANGFYPVWPASCPYVTAVGGTGFNGTTEVVAEFPFHDQFGNVYYQGSSGGGFSNHFSQPSYQSDAVSEYLTALGKTDFNDQNDGKYSPQGRAYPDVSLVALNYVIVAGGKETGEGGTSASAPAWAGMVSSLNDYRVSQGKSTLGFLNPLLYSSAKSAFRDVTAGDNTGCGQPGFPALQGWDAATGLGSVDYGKLRALI